jgi:hypothetical protein
VKFDDLGQQQVKNIPNAIHAYSIAPHPSAIAHFQASRQVSAARRRNVLLAGLAILGVVAVGSAAIRLYLHGSGQNSLAAVSGLVTNREAGLPFDDTKIRALAASQNIPLPPNLRVTPPAASVPAAVAGYLGAWGGDEGWNGKGRRIILVIESVDESGTALGIFAQGPPPDVSNPDRRAARYRPIAGSITDAGLVFTLAGAKYTFRDTSDGLMWGRWQTPGERDNVDLTIALERIN